MSATHESRAQGGRYSTVSILFHWTIAALLITQVFVGGWFSDLDRGPARTQAFGLHFSLGVTILLLSLARLGWRVAHPAPPLPDHMPRWEKLLARATHVGFYVVLLGMPLTGWAMASAGSGPLEVWGVLPWPKIPGIDRDGRELFDTLHHEVILKLFWALLVLHVAGALKHHFLQRDEVLWRMLPIVGRPDRKG
ncbi:MAG TPA: cytochrome b [Caulobacteraceae bacterium]|nr:cytochrome b [Caulobacteraceae bacterium]